MLRELHISNLAVIADARIELHHGLNCFTGTTGAGKSLVIGAVEVLLGLRSPSEMLRAGAEEGRVSGVFEIKDKELLKQVDLAVDAQISKDGGEILITRRLYASGRTSVSLNGNPITLAMLRQVAECLVDVHGQHDHQFLLKPSNQIQVLDRFAELDDLRNEFRSVYQNLQDAKKRLEDLTAGKTLRQQQLELYRFQAQEIDAAELMPAEFEELRSRASILQNLEKLKKDVGSVHAALYEADSSVVERIKMMAGVIAEMAELDQHLKPVSETLRDATLMLEDASFDLSRYLNRLDLDPSELGEVNDRLTLLNRILNKYGDTIEQVLQFREQIGTQIADLEKQSDDLSSLRDEISPLEKELRKVGDQLTKQRRHSADKVAPLIEKQLSELGMEKAKFSIQLSQVPAGADGFDQVEFIVQTNPGLPAQPLRKIASGGELSRIMLALKGILAQGDRVSVLVFDEIDANVGGRLGSIIGSKLRSLADHHQVLCITHLPQIAAYADRHLTVRKESTGKQTNTTVRAISGQERTEELAEMIGGQRITNTTRAQAQELLDAAIETPKKPLRRSKAS